VLLLRLWICGSVEGARKRGSLIEMPQEPRWMGLSVGNLEKNLLDIRYQIASKEDCGEGEKKRGKSYLSIDNSIFSL
jgi:hypothetical protein